MARERERDDEYIGYGRRSDGQWWAPNKIPYKSWRRQCKYKYMSIKRRTAWHWHGLKQPFSA